MAVTQAQLSELYLAYFGRPADLDGLAYYTSSASFSTATVAAGFSASPESIALYGTGFTAVTVNAIYQNLFNRDAEPAGLAFWMNEVTSGRLTAAGAALGILQGAQNDDLKCVQNKLAVAQAWIGHLDTAAEITGYAGTTAATSARDFLHSVTSSDAALTAAVSGIDAAIAAATHTGTTAGTEAALVDSDEPVVPTLPEHLTDGGGDGNSSTTMVSPSPATASDDLFQVAAGHGQGFDTLDVSVLSSMPGVNGILYELSAGGGIVNGTGTVSYSQNAHASLTTPRGPDFETVLLRVDGVENLIGGTGDDMLITDESEAAKNNSFVGGLGNDVVEYQNNYGLGGAAERAAEPTLTIKMLATGIGNETVTMTGGRVGLTGATDTPTDTFTSVEYMNLFNQTATGSAEADTLDVTAFGAAGAAVSYIDGTVKSGGVTQLTIANLFQVENVVADGNDTVIVAPSAIMGLNTTSDLVAAAVDLKIATFLDYDELTAGTATRAAYSALATGPGAGAGQMENWINQNQFHKDLGAGTDTVDYSLTGDAISVRVELDATLPDQFVLVDSSGGSFDAVVAASDRMDKLTSVERIVAAQGESVLDLSQSTKALEIKYNPAVAADKVADSAAFNAYDVNTVRISDLSSATPLSRAFVEYRDAADVPQPAPSLAVNRATATWSRIEGSDFAERVILNSAHSLENDTFNLRGGANEVKYNELTRSITTTLMVQDFVAATPFAAVASGYAAPLYANTNVAANTQQVGTVMAVTQFQDGNSLPLPGGGTHVATSYSADNPIGGGGSLRVAASQDAEDTLQVAGIGDKLFLLSQIGTTDNQITVKLGSATAPNSVILTGYEILEDAASNDVFDMGNLATTLLGLQLVDNAANDHDAIKVGNDAVNFNGAGVNTISLDAINAAVGGFNFIFDVLDVTKVTLNNLILNGQALNPTDEVVLGALSHVAAINNFESIVLTQDSVASGTSFIFDTAAATLKQGSTTVTTGGDQVLSFGGLFWEGELGNSYVPNVTGDLNIQVTARQLQWFAVVPATTRSSDRRATTS